MWPVVLFRRAVSNGFSMASAGLKRKADGLIDQSGGKKQTGPWNMGLKSSMEDPELQVFKDERIVIIKDKYPKARYHFLVLPIENIKNLKSLTKDHLPLLKHMEEEGRIIAKKSSQLLSFRFGYHAIPSMSHVHLHVISQDFDSPSLKTKKHWNSFTSEYFIDSKDVVAMLEKEGKVAVDTSHYEQMLKRDLECHVCHQDFKTIPALKQHILKHVPKESKD